MCDEGVTPHESLSFFFFKKKKKKSRDVGKRGWYLSADGFLVGPPERKKTPLPPGHSFQKQVVFKSPKKIRLNNLV